MSSKHVDTIVFSKDRAAQLDLFLYSFFENFPIGRVTVIYTFSNDKFRDGYETLIQKYGKKVGFLRENAPLKEVFLKVVNECDDFLNIVTDDTVYYRSMWEDFDDIDINDILDKDTLCFSPRLGLNTIVQDYKTGQLQKPLTDYYDDGRSIIHWNWKIKPALENYGFACHQDSYICRKEDFLTIANFNWQNMRELEGTLALERRHTMYYKPMMAAPSLSWCVNVPVNNVLPGLYAGDKCYESLESMNEKFLNGQRLSLEKSDFSNVIGAHQEVKLVWD